MQPWTMARLSATVCLLALLACGGDDDGGSGPPPPDEDPLEVAATPTSSGNGQTGAPGAAQHAQDGRRRAPPSLGDQTLAARQ